MKDHFGTPLAIGDIVVAQEKGYRGQVTDTFRGKIVAAKEQKNGTKLELQRIDFDDNKQYASKDELYGKFSYSVFKYPGEAL